MVFFLCMRENMQYEISYTIYIIDVCQTPNKYLLKENSNMKQKIDQKIIMALYIVNKSAKQYRDMISANRKAMKEYLFNHNCDNLYALPEEYSHNLEDELQFAVPLYYDYNPIYSKKQLFEIEKENNIYFEDSINDIMSNEGFDDYYIFDLINYSRKELLDLNISKDAIEQIETLQAEKVSDDKEITRLLEQIDNLHDYLHYGNRINCQIKDNLYKLKSAVLILSGEQPICFHHIIGSDDTLLAYYVFDGYSFHLPVDLDEVNDNMIKDIEIGNVSSTIKQQISLDLKTACNILLSYCGLSDRVLANQLLSGELIDFEELCNISIWTPNYIHSEKNYHARKNIDYDDYDDYNDYDDYDDYDDYLGL